MTDSTTPHGSAGTPPAPALAPDPATPPRALALEGLTNFRDLGGYPGLQGRPVKWRRLFRSDQLGALTPADQQRLAELGIARAVDFRGMHERAAQPYTLPGVTQYALHVEPMVVQRVQELLQKGSAPTPAETVRLMQDTYRAFVHDNAPRFAELLQLLLASDAPLVFHCTAGKDRTGFAAALILLALGVPRDVVMQDYLLTNALYRPPFLASSSTPREVLEVIWFVREDFLDAALRLIDAEYGGPEPYLERVLGLNAAARAKLAQLYLQPPY
jgi:protein-tyrosine phosphatase